MKNNMQKYNARQILREQLIKKGNGQPYTSYIGLCKRLRKEGFEPSELNAKRQMCFALTKEDIENL